ncbi:MAG: RNA methyltransferase [Candidatus Polarisedimenticolia bacterium]
MPDDPFARTAFILLRPKSPGNVGSTARAMKNMGFRHLILADPMSYEDPEYFHTEAGRMAWNASDVLQEMRQTPTLEDALAPYSFVLGTTSVPPPGARALRPEESAREVAALLHSDPSARAALLFGQEDIGLTRDQLARCQAIGVIPAAAAYPSLNLAQAALVFAWELRRSLLGPAGEGATAEPSSPDARPPQERLESFYVRLEEALDEIAFLQGSSRAHMMRELRQLFNRTLLTTRELAMLEGIVHQVMWAARRGKPPRA